MNRRANMKGVSKVAKAEAEKRKAGRPPNAKDKGPRKVCVPRITKHRFLKALEGTAGLYTEIARRLNCAPSTIVTKLRRDDWEDMRQAYHDEREKVSDLAEQTLVDVLEGKGGVDDKERVATAKWFLQRRRRGDFGDTMTVEGGKKPIKTESVSVSIDSLELPIEIRRSLLQAIEEGTNDNGNNDSTEEQDVQ